MPDHRQPYREFVTPEDFPVRSPSPPDSAIDNAQKMGGLMEAVAGLKLIVKEQGDKISTLSHELHGYKTGFTWVKWILGGLVLFIAWLTKLYIDLHAVTSVIPK